MKPPPFDYRRPSSLEEALALLAALAPEAKIIAGGQSLAPMLNMRLARPEVLIDIGRLPGLRSIRMVDGQLLVGALTRHDQFEHYPARLHGFDVLRQVAPLIGHQPIRTRGTFGGSIAHADGAAEWCLLSLLLDAQFVARSVRGERVLHADSFFHGLFTTALAEDEIIVLIRFPRPRVHAALEEFARRHGDFAIAAAAVAFDVEDGRLVDPRVVVGGVSSRPERCAAAEDELRDAPAKASSFEAAGRALSAAISPREDVHATAEARRRLASNLLQRAGVRALHNHTKVSDIA